jgi:hypothetical protein
MWRTSKGDRVLQGAEWELFRTALSEVWDLIEDSFDDGELFSSGVDAFDTLQPGQKLALLAIVGKALSDQSVPTPAHTAHNEATIAAVFQHVRQSVLVEIETQDEPESADHATYWRGLVLAACREISDEWDHPLPAATCDDAAEWELLVECLADQVLWDADYEMGDQFLDADPDAGRELLKKMRIAEDYYLAVAPDPTAAEVQAVRRTLCEVTGHSGPEERALLPGLLDTHHDLLVGPCAPEEVTRETACRLVQEICVGEPDDFDCSYAEWLPLFRQEALQAALEPTGPPDPAAVLSPEQRARAGRAQQAGGVLTLEDGHRIEPRGAGWVVRDEHGWFLVDVEDCSWTDDGDDPDPPPVRFGSVEDAYAALVYAETAAAARAERRDLAIRRLRPE